jgi:hypothetical protein
MLKLKVFIFEPWRDYGKSNLKHRVRTIRRAISDQRKLIEWDNSEGLISVETSLAYVEQLGGDHYRRAYCSGAGVTLQQMSGRRFRSKYTLLIF